MSDTDKFALVNKFVADWQALQQPPPIPSRESANGTHAKPGVGEITDTKGVVHKITAGGVITRNDMPDTTTQRVIDLVYTNRVVQQTNADNNKWNWSNDTWVAVPGPITGGGNPAKGEWSKQRTGNTDYYRLLPSATPKRAILFLHQLENASQMPGQPDPWFNNAAFRMDFPDVMVLVPLCVSPTGENHNWGGVRDDADTHEYKDMVAFCKQLLQSGYTDIYVTGNSMGGLGAWNAAIRDTSTFTAALILAGSTYNNGNATTVANKLKDYPLWVIHGKDDTEVKPDWDRSMSSAMKAINGKMKYTELNMGHDVWDTVYPDRQYMSWLLGQRKSGGNGTTQPPVPTTGASLPLPLGPLSTRGAAIIASDGTPVRIASIGWNQQFDNIDTDVKAMRGLGFNCIRISWVNATRAQDMRRIDQVVTACQKYNMRVIIDNHHNANGGPQQENGLWYGEAGITDKLFLDQWVEVAKHYVGAEPMIGYDIRNEPTNYGKGAAWGNDNGPAKSLQSMYTRVGRAIQEVDSNKLIICEGSQDYNAGAPMGDLRGVRALPVQLPVANKVVYSIHDYAKSIGGVVVSNQQRQSVWGYLITEGIAPVWVGECGCDMTTQEDQDWADAFLQFIRATDPLLGTDWWAWGRLDGQKPRGILSDYDKKVPRPEQFRVWSQLQYNRT